MLTIMRLCERFHWTPAELESVDALLIADFLTILRYEAEHQEMTRANGRS